MEINSWTVCFALVTYYKINMHTRQSFLTMNLEAYDYGNAVKLRPP